MTKAEAFLICTTAVLGGAFLFKNRKKIQNSIENISKKHIEENKEIYDAIINRFTKKEEIVDVEFTVIE